MMIRRKQGKPLALSLCDGNAKCRLIPVSKILTCHIIHSYLLERYIHYALPLMFSFLRATEHRGGGGGEGGQLRMHLLFQKQPSEVFFGKRCS